MFPRSVEDDLLCVCMVACIVVGALVGVEQERELAIAGAGLDEGGVRTEFEGR